MRNTVKRAAVLILAATMIAGCGKSSRSAAIPDESSIPEDTVSVSEDTIYLGNDNIGGDESMTQSEMIASAGDTEHTKGNIKEELPDYLKADNKDSSASPSLPETEAGAGGTDTGEGINAAVGTGITAAANAQSCALGETYTIHAYNGDIDLTVNSVDVVKNTDPLSSAKKIVRVNYTYTNVSSEVGLLVASIFFRLADDEGNALGAYDPDYTLDENPEPQVVEKGQTCEAVIAFELYEDPAEMTLFFDDQTTGAAEAQELFWVIKA